MPSKATVETRWTMLPQAAPLASIKGSGKWGKAQEHYGNMPRSGLADKCMDGKWERQGQPRRPPPDLACSQSSIFIGSG
jgi:hypothetical protein